MPPGNENTVRRISIVIDSKGVPGLKDLAKQMGGVNKSIKETNSTLGSLKTGFNALLFGSFAGVGLQTLTNFADSMQNLESRIRILSTNSEEAQRTMQGLLATANRTKTSIDGLATIYARLAASTEEAGLSSTTLLRVTEVLQNSFRLSGATTAEATNAAIQLSQGFASGQLRGQELRSVLEQNVVVGGILSKTLGRTRGELFKFAEQGKLTSGVVLKALLDSADDVNKKAAQLGQTFEQTLTVALNDFKFALNELNKEFDLSNRFSRFVAQASSDIRVLVGVLKEIGQAGRDAKNFFTDFIPEGASLELSNYISTLRDYNTARETLDAIEKAGSVRGAFTARLKEIKDGYDSVRASVIPVIISTKELLGLNAQFERQSLANVQRITSQNALESLIAYQEEEEKYIRESIARFKEEDKAKKEADRLNKNGNEILDKRSTLLRSLNAEYLAQEITVSQYYNQLQKLDKLEAKRLFLDGKKDLEQYNEELRKIKETEINREFNQMYISYERFNSLIEENGIERLNEQLQAGKINALEYDQAMVKLSSKFLPGSALRAGAADYIQSIGTISQQVATAISGTFSKLEDSLVEFTKNGKFNFSDFAQSVLDDLNRIIIRSLIIRPLADGIIGGFASESYGATASTNAQRTGAAPFAKGGIFDSPTMFSYGRGKLGVMGEAGPEAVLPLTRGGDGSLGVAAASSPVYVNITNNTDSSITQTETTDSSGNKVIDVLIESKVKAGIASGAYDRTMQQAYGLKRRGN